MTKYISKSQIVGDKGVAKFNSFCVNHDPYIIFREKSKHDFGIDGEIELVRKNEENKFEVTGEIIAVQIKSSYSNTGYIKKESETSIEISIRKDDVEYWSNYKTDVLLIFYDDRNDDLYCHKISPQDHQFIQRGLANSIEFNKLQDKLIEGNNNFLNKYSAFFKERVNFSAREQIFTNLHPYKKIPKILYQFTLNGHIKSKKTFYEAFSAPTDLVVAIYANQVFSFEDLRKIEELKDVLAPDNVNLLNLSQINLDKDIQNHFIELLNLYLKKFLYLKGLDYSKDYRRYYFHKPKNSLVKEITYKSRYRTNTRPKTVVSYHEYARDKFFRHHAVEIQHHFLENTLYISLLPKYLFTKDGKETLPPDKITKYTNYLTAREFNKQVLGYNSFIFSYLAGKSKTINIWESKDFDIILMEPKRFDVNFGIPLDTKKRKINKKAETDNTIQTSLPFFNDED
ncbi:MAG: DUF4365 domain-containing protein [Bacteroidales bacterium]|nr:DUF4365 domain-containing protein [Bacteroidales bacterium]